MTFSRRLHVVALLPALAVLPALASDPGQPLDCTDWVFLEPGYTCSPWVPYPCNRNDNPLCAPWGAPRAFDNAGRLYRAREILSHRIEPCGGLDRIELLRYDGTSEEVFAYVEERCDGPRKDGSDGGAFDVLFDPTHGRLLLTMTSSCGGSGCAYATADWIASFEGFATTFDILHTYDPLGQQLGVRVPYMPEGLPAADYFDTYYGDLATVGDWSQAQPLQCGYPATAPSVGDYLTVADPLPDPAPGQGRYYVTAVTYQGEKRYGRRSRGGVLASRIPAVLPSCADR